MTRFRKSLVSLAAIAVLAGCGATSGRYLIDTPAPTQQVRVPLSTIEVRDVTLPDYVSSAEIMVQSEDGALRPVANAIWADNPVRGFTLMLARNLDTGSNAAAMTEPWPLTEPPHARVEVRVEQMVAQIDGTFRLTGQFAISWCVSASAGLTSSSRSAAPGQGPSPMPPGGRCKPCPCKSCAAWGAKPRGLWLRGRSFAQKSGLRRDSVPVSAPSGAFPA